MNVLVDPCDDFYSYACGKFVKNTELQPGEESVTSLELIQKGIDNRLEELLSRRIEPGDISPYKTAKALYSTCKDKKYRSRIKARKLIEIIEALGGVPLLKGSTWNVQNFHWVTMIKKFRQLGFNSNYFLHFDVVQSLGYVGGDYIMQILPPTTIFTRSQLEHRRGKEENDRYRMYIKRVMRHLMNVTETEMFDQDVNDLIKFEKTLIKMMSKNISQETNRNLTLKELDQQFDFIDWFDYITALLPDGTVINEHEFIIVPDTQYLKDLEMLLGLTSGRVIANYLMWRIIDFSLPYLSDESQRIHSEYHIKLKPISCTMLVRRELPIVSSALYAKTFLNNQNNEDLKSQVVEDVESIVDVTVGLLKWVDDETKKWTKKNRKATTKHINVPEELLNTDHLMTYFSDLQPRGNTLLEIILGIHKFHLDKDLRKLKQTVDIREWTRHSDLVNILDYKPARLRTLSIPAPLIEEQLTYNETSVIDYATIGVTVARDYIYKFLSLENPNGNTFDTHGNLWTNETKTASLPHVKCFIDQYSKLQTPDGVKTNGNLLKYENIADVGALRVAYVTFSYLGDTVEERLPGIEFNEPKQIFWTKAAQSWCSKYTPDSLKRELLKGNRMPGKFKVNGSFTHLLDFAKDFKCPVGSPMNLGDKSCYKFWDAE